MRFKKWIESNDPPQSIAIPCNKLFGLKPKIMETLDDIEKGRLSRSTGNPITVSKLDSPRGFFIMDGYHRTFEELQKGSTSIIGTVSPYLPKIQRSGGAFSWMLQQLTPIMPYVKLSKS
jgi:hypothetical protein